MMRPASGEILRYVIAGSANTSIGYGVFLVMLLWANLRPELANAVGYGVGLGTAFALNRLFVFKGALFSLGAFVRFSIGFVFAFSLNQAMLLYLVSVLDIRPEIAQVFAMTTYTVFFYLINKYFVWK
jgi:putative flippase GtrA